MQTMGNAMMMAGHGHSHGGCGPPALDFTDGLNRPMLMGHGHSHRPPMSHEHGHGPPMGHGTQS